MQTALHTGDIVHLNSGSPELRVVALADGKATVEWASNGVTRQMSAPIACFCKTRQSGGQSLT